MPKINHGLIWSEDHADKSITIGFTQTCIDQQLQECFHVLPAETKEVREKGPLLVLETNDGLQSIKAPFAGRVSYFNPKARNFPDRIKESETIVTLVPKGAEVKKEPPKYVKAQRVQDAQELWEENPFQVRINPPQPPDPAPVGQAAVDRWIDIQARGLNVENAQQRFTPEQIAEVQRRQMEDDMRRREAEARNRAALRRRPLGGR